MKGTGSRTRSVVTLVIVQFAPSPVAVLLSVTIVPISSWSSESVILYIVPKLEYTSCQWLPNPPASVCMTQSKSFDQLPAGAEINSIYFVSLSVALYISRVIVTFSTEYIRSTP